MHPKKFGHRLLEYVLERNRQAALETHGFSMCHPYDYGFPVSDVNYWDETGEAGA